MNMLESRVRCYKMIGKKFVMTSKFRLLTSNTLPAPSLNVFTQCGPNIYLSNLPIGSRTGWMTLVVEQINDHLAERFRDIRPKKFLSNIAVKVRIFRPFFNLNQFEGAFLIRENEENGF